MEDASNTGEIICVNIKTANDAKNVTVEVSLQSSVADLKNKVLKALEMEDKHVRLVSAGKMLSPDSAIVSSFGLKDKCFVHAVITSAPSPAPIATPVTASSTSLPRANVTVYRGFDRFVSAGLSLDETAALRSSFSEQVSALAASSPRQDEESDVEYRYRLEEEWIEAQGPRSDFMMNLPVHDERAPLLFQTFQLSRGDSEEEEVGSTLRSRPWHDFLFGLFMGYGLGFIMMFCIWDRNVSQHQRMGVLIGILLNMLFGLWQQQRLDAAQHKNHHSSEDGADEKIPPAATTSHLRQQSSR